MKNNIIQLRGEIERWFAHSVLGPIDMADGGEAIERGVQIFETDFNRYFPETTEVTIDKLRLSAELQGILLYRIARQFFLRDHKLCDHFAYLGRYLSGFEIYYSADIGAGLRINHGLGTVVGARVVMGKNCLLHQGITIGDKGNGTGRPTVGDNVTVYAGAKILGNIQIGDHAIIGANAVCLQDVPADTVALGIPAKNVRKK